MKKFDLEKELLEMVKKGSCPALIYDDNGHWYLATSGFQPFTGKISATTFFIDDKKAWKKTIRGAVEYSNKRGDNEKQDRLV